jgi:putative tryptophan/tyrosine transport system substrate-binding protein
MNRRDALISLLALGALPRCAGAQQAGRTWRMGLLRGAPDDAVFRQNYSPFISAMRELGFVDGANLRIESRVAPGRPPEILAWARELVDARVDAILAIATVSVTAAARATTAIPIVAVDLESDPVALKFAANLGRPAGNVTGLFLDFPELSGKWLEFLKSAMPNFQRAAVLYDPAIGPYLMRGAEAAGESMKVQLIRLSAASPAEFERAFQSAAAQKAEVLLALSSPVFNSARRQIAELSLKHRLPAIMPFPYFADDGGLMGYGPHLPSLFGQAAVVMAKILRGERAANIPIERPSRFELALNLKTARALGITIPTSLLVRADRVIE